MPNHLFWRLTPNGVEPCSGKEWEIRSAQDPVNRRIGHDNIGGVTISTVFSGINTQTEKDGPPILYHTVIFGKEARREEAYATREEAIEGHRRWVAHYQDQIPPDDNIGNKL